VSGVVLPGLIKSIEVKHDALVEEQEVQGSSAKAKQATGYEDAKITIELILEDSPKLTKKQKLEKIQNLFLKSGQKKPIVHEIINEHTAARKIKKVIFKSLGTKEENKKEQLTVSLEFWTYNTMKIKATKSTGKKKSTTNTSSYSLDPAYQNYLNNNRGSAPSKSPAVDNAHITSYSNKLTNMPY
jgi:hypothetical protein